MQRGYTIIELLIVMVLITIIAVFVSNSFIEYKDTQVHRAAVLEVSSVLKETKMKTVSSETDAQLGIHVSTSSLVVFEGVTYNSADVTNVTFPILGATLDATLSDSSSEVVFARLSGVPSATGTIDVIDSKLNSTTTLTITGSGLVE